MKNALILAGLLVVALTGCGEKKAEQAAPAPEAAPAVSARTVYQLHQGDEKPREDAAQVPGEAPPGRRG